MSRDDEEGMDDALERARARPRDTRDLYDILDDEGPPDVISGGAEPDPDLTTAADFPPEPMRSPAPPTPAPAPAPAAQPAAAPPESSARLAAIRRMQSMLDEPAPGPSDADIASASERDRSRVRSANLAEAIAAAFQRRPARLQQEPSEAEALQSQRASSLAGQNAKMGMSARLAAALRESKGGAASSLTPYQLEQIKRNAVLDEQRREQEAYARKQHEGERKENLDWRKTQHEDSLGMQRALFGYKKERDVEEDAKDLNKAVGAEPEHLQGLLSRLDAATTQKDIPGVGPIDKLTPDIVASDKALQTRNDMREAVRIMLSMKSGKTVTPQEAEDYARIYGINGSEEAFRQGVRRLRADVADTVKAKKAGFTPEAVHAYEKTGGAATPQKAGPPSAEKPPPGAIPPDATNVRRFKKGWAYTLPDGTEEAWEP